MSELLLGEPVCDHILARMSASMDKLKNRPALGVIRVGMREDDVAYESALKRKCESVGIDMYNALLPYDASEMQVMNAIAAWNADAAVDGILLFQPLPNEPPKNMTRIRNAISAEKDVDVISDASLARVFLHPNSSQAPCTAEACKELLQYYGIPLRGAEVVIVGRSYVIGRPLAAMLLQQNATVTVCHTQTRDLPSVCKRADILIAASGSPKLIGPNCVREDQIVLDVGVHVLPTGEMCGDVDGEAVSPIVRALTPVPRGIGSVTTTVLLEHVCKAAVKREEKTE